MMKIGLDRSDRMVNTLGMWTRRGALGLLALLAGRPAHAQVPAAAAPAAPAQAAAADSLESINADYLKALDALEVKRIERLGKLAQSTTGEASDQAYVALFQGALSGGHYVAAEPIAERLIKEGHGSHAIRYLAAVTNILAECDRGAFNETLVSIEQALKDGSSADAEEKEVALFVLPRDTRLSILETYYQKLVQAREFEIARKAFTLMSQSVKDPALSEYAKGRLARLNMVGQPAPPLVGTDVDDKPFDLAKLKGQAVLIVFWASWCMPSSSEADMLYYVGKAYKEKGLRIVGVNVDNLQEDVGDPASIIPDVRRFLVEHNVMFPNLINGTGPADHARAFGVTDIPSNFLVGRDGRIVEVDLTPTNIDSEIERALAAPAQ